MAAIGDYFSSKLMAKPPVVIRWGAIICSSDMLSYRSSYLFDGVFVFVGVGI